ncbi:putative signal transducing protein [Paenibacillus sp. BAC0078]
MSFLKAILHFFIPRERTLLYTTFDQAQYFRAKGRLTSQGIPHRSKINGGMQALGQRALYSGKTSVQHDLYVRKEDEHRAAQAIR